MLAINEDLVPQTQVQLPVDRLKGIGDPCVPAAADFSEALASPWAGNAGAPLCIAAYALQLHCYGNAWPIYVEVRRGSVQVLEILPRDDASSGELLELCGRLLARGGVSEGKASVAGVLEFTELAQFDSRLQALLSMPEAGAGLHWLLCEDQGRPRASLILDSSVISADTAQRIGRHWLALMGWIKARPAAPALSLEPMDGAEQSLLDAAMTGAPPGSTPEDPLQLFARHARSHPDDVAVSYGLKSQTYGQLDAVSDRLALALRAVGVGRHCHVAIALAPCLDVAACWIALSKLGAIYVPLDPQNPGPRLSVLLQDVGARCLLVSEDGPASPLDSVRRLTIAELLATVPEGSRCVVEHPGAPTDPAYVFYTSGTTGTPKGVVGNRGNFAFYVAAALARYGLRRHDVMPMLARLSFSISLFEVVAPLCCGGSIQVLDREDVLDVERLSLVLERVTVFHAGPSLLRRLVNHVKSRGTDAVRYSRVRHASTGGDLAPPELLEDMKRVFAMAEIFVIYGCSEVSVMGTTYEVPREVRIERTLVGKAFPGTRIRVFDTFGRRTAIGVAGEVHISGPGVIAGYLNRPELNATRFATLDGIRYYNTGDIGRITKEGFLQLLGRLDFQVQVRGMRVELGEVEYALRKAPGVLEGVVSSFRDTDDDVQLVAYYVPTPGLKQDAAALRPDIRRHLLDNLPEFMVPSTYVALDALPLNSNLKVDRKALPDPRSAGASKARSIDPAASTQERSILTAFRGLLHRDDVGLDDDFFEVGGHSLTVMRAITWLSATFGFDASPRLVFDNPTVRKLSRAVTAARDSGTPGGGAGAIVPVAREERTRLSAAQERMWFWSEFAPDLALYNIPILVQISGPLSLPKIQQSLDYLLVRHEVLRSRWMVHEGAPYQTLVQNASWPLVVARRTHRSREENDRAAEERGRGEVLLPFDLTRELPVRALVVERDENEYSLYLTLHHSVCDGWSTEILLEDLFRRYAEIGQDAPEARALPLQYLDFSAWDNQRLAGGLRARELAYWRDKLADVPPVLDLPTDYARPATQRFKGSVVPVEVSASALDGMKAAAHRSGATLFMLLVAAWQTLLHRLSGQQSFVTGSVVANRDRSELDGLIGYFANTVALRADIDEALTLRGLIERARKGTLEALEHQHVPFEEVVEALNVPRDNSRMPLIQTFFELQPPVGECPAPKGLTIERNVLATPVARFDLSLVLQEVDGSLVGAFEFDSDLYDAASISRWKSYFLRILDACCGDTSTRVGSVPILPPAEEAMQILVWNSTLHPYDNAVPVHRRFEEQVRRTPGAIALRFDGGSLTYDQLNRQANRLAHHLRECGVGANSPVGVCMERSMELVVAIFAILKSGGAYVPMDPELPPERLSMILADVDQPLVLTHKSVLSLPCATAIRSTRFLSVDEELPGMQSRPDADLPQAAGPADTAYIIFTSGSTGRPKGVEVLHVGLSNHINWMVDALRVTPQDRLLQKTTISFDSSVADFFLSLQVGGRLVIAAPGGHRDLAYLTQLVQDEGCTLIQFVPSALRFLVDEPGLGKCTTLRYVISIGEALEWETALRFRRLLPAATLSNFYGPTEATDHTTWYEVPMAPDGHGTVPIGRPIANVVCRVLDKHRQLVPVGVAGELYIGGAGVARGYRHLPDLTSERFVDDPYRPGERMYRTGDIVRYRPDGTLVYIGRADHQVKIRGFRIELGEIESAIQAVAPMLHCAVIINERGADKQLIAYVSGSQVPAAELRQRLSTRLPDYMMPVAFVEIEQMPFLTNGKINRKALPKPDVIEPVRARVEPRTDTEKSVAGVFMDVLELQAVSANDSFFDLGGHSLLAGRIIARLRKNTGLELPLRLLFEHPTVSGMAMVIDAMRWSAAGPSGGSGGASDFEEIVL